MILVSQADVRKRRFAELTHRVSLATADNEIIRLFVAHYSPNGLNIVGRMPPIPLRIQIAQLQFLGNTKLYSRDIVCDLSRYILKTTTRRFVIEQYSAYSKESVSFSVIPRQVKSRYFGNPV